MQPCPGQCDSVGWSVIHTQKIVGLIPGQGTYPGCQFNTQSGYVLEGSQFMSVCLSLSLSPSLLSYLSKSNGKKGPWLKIFKKLKNKKMQPLSFSSEASIPWAWDGGWGFLFSTSSSWCSWDWLTPRTNPARALLAPQSRCVHWRGKIFKTEGRGTCFNYDSSIFVKMTLERGFWPRALWVLLMSLWVVKKS